MLATIVRPSRSGWKASMKGIGFAGASILATLAVPGDSNICVLCGTTFTVTGERAFVDRIPGRAYVGIHGVE